MEISHKDHEEQLKCCLKESIPSFAEPASSEKHNDTKEVNKIDSLRVAYGEENERKQISRSSYKITHKTTKFDDHQTNSIFYNENENSNSDTNKIIANEEIAHRNKRVQNRKIRKIS
jgi:hypothetical protein